MLEVLLHELLDRQDPLSTCKAAPLSQSHLQAAVELILEFASFKMHLIAQSQQILPSRAAEFDSLRSPDIPN
jgi:hypothetical protein